VKLIILVFIVVAAAWLGTFAGHIANRHIKPAIVAHSIQYVDLPNQP
jgi:hypothetical protein